MLVILVSLSSFAQQTLWVGQSYTFDVSSSVMGITANMSWSTNGGYLSLSGSGFYRTITVTQYFSGTATVTCEWDYKLTGNGSYTHTKRQVTISCRDNQVSISPTSMTMSPGETRYVSYRHQYDNQYTSAANAYFQSTNPSVARVDERTGEVYAVNSGTAYINVYSKVSSTSPYCLVTVNKVEPTSVSLPNTLTMTVGETKTLTPSLYPSNAQTSFTWTSSNSEVATVNSSGYINAKKHGNTTIQVYTTNGLNASCDVTVNKKQLTISSNIQSGIVRKGTELTLTSPYKDVEIYYTTDGTKPTVMSSKYEGTIIISDDITINAFAILDGYIDSEVLALDFEVTSLDLTANQSALLYNYQHIQVEFNEEIKKDINFDKITVSADDREIDFLAIIQDASIYIVLDEKIPGVLYTVSIPAHSVINRLNQTNFNIIQSYKYKVDNNRVNFKSIACAGQLYCLALTEDGHLYSWGSTSDPIGRDCINYEDAQTPAIIGGLENVIKYGISSKYGGQSQTSYALTSDGVLYAWGENEYGELGQGNRESVKYPIVIQRGVKDAYAANRNLFFVKTDGTLWGAGDNEYHQLGIESSSTYIFKKLLDNVSRIGGATQDYCYVIKEDSSLWGSGGHHTSYYDWYLGNASGTSKNFVKILENVREVYVSSGYADVFAITNDLYLYGWGYNEYGELGLGHKNKILTPSIIKDNITDISITDSYVLAIDVYSKLWAWGDNEYGSLGTGNNVSTLVPVFVHEDIKSIECISHYSSAIDNNNNLLSWGDNGNGWYHNGESLSTKSRVTPELILTNIKDRDTAVRGGTYNYAIGLNGCLWYWTINPPKTPKMEGIDKINHISCPKNITIYKDKYGVIPLTIDPINGYFNNIEWYSDNEDIVKCTSQGLLLSKKTGEANVSVSVIVEGKCKYTSTTHVIVVEDNDSGILDTIIDSSKDIEIYNLQGLPCKAVDINNIPSGIYILKQGNAIKKIIVK